MLTPTISIDNREQDPLPICGPHERATLYSGDYGVKGLSESGLFSVERKTVPDLVNSLTRDRERFARECHRLRGYRFKRLLVIGAESEIRSGRYRSRANPQSVLASLWAFEARYDLPVVFARTPEDGARLVERWAYWTSREYAKAAAALAPDPEEQERGGEASPPES